MASLGAKIRKHRALKERALAMFREAGDLFNKEILPAMKLKRSGRAKIGRKETAVLVNQFEEKGHNTIFKNAAVDQYRVDIETAA